MAMMILDLWVLGLKLDLYADTGIKHTLQINDIAEVKDRQASYTNSFKVPKTSNNKRIFDGLGIASDTSRLPYTKPNCTMKLQGFDFITSGWLNVSETNDDYQCYLYSGLINFFKAIENKSLGDLDLSEIEHTKSLSSVVNSISNPNYKYLLTDYNGKTHYGPNGEIVNIDYLIPSVSVKYLWDKIHSTYSYNYFGAVFDTPEFTNLWLTYPKFIAVDEATELINGDGSREVSVSGNANSYYRGIPIQQLTNYSTFTALETAQYRIKLHVQNSFIRGGISGGYPVRYYMSTNQEGIPYAQRTNYSIIKEVSSTDGAFDIELLLTLNQGDQISFYDYFEMNGTFWWNSTYELLIEQIIPGNSDFSNELKDFSITDFVKEILTIFSLTLFTSEFELFNLKYRTFEERLATADIKDWSNKYIERSSEKYTYKSYAQWNYFTYQYNDKEASFHNGTIKIDNLNLAERTQVFNSRTYSPEKTLSEFFLGSEGNRFLRLFKFYDKNIKEENNETKIEYKGLDKRFHFVRAQRLDTTVTLGSETLLEQQTVSTVYLASFTGLDWTTLLNKNYIEFGRVLNDSRIHNISLNLNMMDFMDFDFNSIIYFEQEQQYYIPNKLQIDYDTGKAAGEFVRLKMDIDKTDVDPEDPITKINITWGDNTIAIKQGVASTEVVKVASLEYPVDDELIAFEWERFNGTSWIGLGTGITPYTVTLASGLQKYRLKGTSVNSNIFYSNELQYTRLVYVCKAYKAWTYGNSGDDLTVFFINCDGEEDTLSVYAPGGTMDFYLELNFCAQEGSVSAGRATLEDQGYCAGYECLQYRVSKVAAFVGDTMNFSYTSCEGFPISQTATATVAGETMEETFCALNDTVVSDSGYILIGPC